MPLPSSLPFCPQELEHVDQGIQIPSVLHFLGDDVFAGDAGDGAAQIGQQEVMQGSLPAAHAGAYDLLLDVLAQSSSLLSELGMEGSGEVTHGVEGMLIPLEEHFFGVFTEDLSHASMHGLLFCAAHVFTEDGVTTVDKLTVDARLLHISDMWYS